MATNPDSIERDPNPIQKIVKTIVSKGSSSRRTLLLVTIAGIIGTCPVPINIFGSALVVYYVAVETKR
jgi:hypothetical protein